MFLEVLSKARRRMFAATLLASVALLAVAVAQAAGPTVSGKSESSPLPADSNAHSVAAKCSGNDDVIGGGARNQFALTDEFAGSYPTGSGKWTAVGLRYAHQGNPGEITSDARCLSSGSVETRVKEVKLTQPGNAISAVAKCKSDEQLLGGGARLSNPVDDFIEGTYPTGENDWKAVGVTYTGDPMRSITSYALCAKHVTTKQERASQAMNGEDLYSATAKCPKHFDVTGGGAKVSNTAADLISGSYPKGDSWVAQGQVEGPPSNLTTYAICLK